ncbi:barstar family protein [Paenibacillus alvei]|uniref:Barstar family protein n=1 Tax=Paenibacillus alvei TaxID=44250 RepID=A0ABT4GZ79_PAEAL|nr:MULTISPECIES: barstar family protein [Paenibacillus]EJW15798.1 barstar, RNAse (barnase) inhibitor [Paenibacillus alvei DSM 29]MCY7484566.1 barstar family protein [Paenibacillus alvei]MCY9706229.1 barstar family protein [Paenibacillus alvei]MCY9735329.1 barstar family protein [Paenibacillus alvei]MCY9758631.1 barstar family protein [Paenibacillus alvei]
MTRRVVELDGRAISSRNAVHDVLSEVLELPDYYGRNLDALWDCLTEASSLPLTIHWSHYEASKKQLGEYCEQLLQLFRDAEAELDGFKVKITR